jgi:menaquinone-9 beta-reductase
MSAPTEIGAEAEVAVVGAGPAGSSAAAALAELGHDVLLIDKDDFPREKPCGDGVMYPGVLAAERLGLNEMIDSSLEMEGLRVVVGHRRDSTARFLRSADRPLPRSITRHKFDAALLGAARERGARFLRARVDGREGTPHGQRLLAVGDDGPIAIRAGFVIAADGPTSRMRRTGAGAQVPPPAYAIRQYFRTERPLDSIFQLDLPLEVDGRVLPGYGWVFPIDEHLANVGAGFVVEPHHPAPSLRSILTGYLDELRIKAGRRFGDLEPLGDPAGSPVGLRDRIEIAEVPGLALVGDAAGTTHPFTGEGISFAIRSGEAFAAEIHERSKRGARRPLGPREVRKVWKSFPQVGSDFNAAFRILVLELNSSPGGADSRSKVSEPFLQTLTQLSMESAYDTAVGGTPAWGALQAHDPDLARSLEGANEFLLGRLADPMPFVTEVIHGSIRSHLGPMYAAVVVAAAAGVQQSSPTRLFEAGIAAETVGVLPKLLTLLVDQARSKQLKVNNAWAMLTGDFAATQSLVAAAKLGPKAVAALARAGRGGCEGGMRDAAARFLADRSPENWMAAALESEGTAMVLATEFGALVRGEDIAAATPLREFGLELGVAVRMAEEIVDLTVGESAREGQAGLDLSRGIYALPVLYAVEADPSLRAILARHTAEGRDATEVVEAIRATGALDRAIAECAQHSRAARKCAEAWSEDGTALAALADVPGEYLAARLPAEVFDGC